MQNPMQEDSLYATQEQQEMLDFQTDFLAVGFVRDEQPAGEYVLLTPNAAKALIDKDIKVFMQHGFSESSAYTEMDYADVGVEFEDDLFQLSNMVKVLVKYQPFSEYQTAFIKDRQTILSVQNPAEITASQMELLLMRTEVTSRKKSSRLSKRLTVWSLKQLLMRFLYCEDSL